MSEKYGYGSPNPEGRHQIHSGGEWLPVILALVAFLFAWMIFSALIKYLSVVSTWIYYPFAAPLYLNGYSETKMFLICLLYAAIGLGSGVIWKVIKGKVWWVGIVYGIFWIVVGVVIHMTYNAQIINVNEKQQVLMTYDSMTQHISYLCKPSKQSALYPFFCTLSPADIGKLYGKTEIMKMVFLPNLVFGIWAVFIAIKNIRSLLTHPKAKAKASIRSTDQLINTMANYYPHLQVYRNIDPNQIDHNSGQLRLMDTPKRFVFENKLVDSFVERPKKSGVDTYNFFNELGEINRTGEFNINNDYIPVVNPVKFNSIMTKQLGSVYTSVDELNSAQTIVLAIIAPLVCRKDLINITDKQVDTINKKARQQADEVWQWVAFDVKDFGKPKKPKLTKKLKKSLPLANKLGSEDDEVIVKKQDRLSQYPNLPILKEQLHSWIEHDIIKEIIESHAYVNTIILRCLHEAKKLGVFQPAQLRWLQFYDRELYALIQNDGRPSVFSENLGSSSHYIMELKARQKIYKPNFEVAFDGLMENLSAYRYENKHIQAFNHWQQTGDAEGMKDLFMVSEDFK